MGDRRAAAMHSTILNYPFQQEGSYEFEVYVDGLSVGASTLTLIQS
jgi:hypothetical protein